MSLSSFVGQQAVGTATGSLAVTGVGFQPKVVIFWMVAQTGTGQGVSYQASFGAASGSAARFAVMASADSGVTTTIVRNGIFTTRCLWLNKADGSASEFVADFTSMDADGFTLNRITAASSSWVMNFLCLGGTDVASALVGSHAFPVGTGTDAVTGVGFQPNVVIFGCPGTTSTSSGTANNHRGFSVGWATGSSARATALFGGQNGLVLGSSTEGSMVSTTKCLGSTNSSDSSLETAADFVSMDSDGFTLNKTAGGSATLYGFIALSVTNVAAVTMSMQGSTGNFSITGQSFTPGVAFLLCHGGASATETAPASDITWSFGAAVSSSQRGSIWIGDKAGLGTDAPEQRQDATRCLMRYDPASPFAVISDLDFVSFNSDGATFNQATADAAGTLVPVLLLGGAAPVVGTTGATAWSARQATSQTPVISGGLF